MSLEQIDEMYQEVMPLNSYKFRRRLMDEGRFGAVRTDSNDREDAEKK